METVSAIRLCSFCKEEIHKDAIKCKHCGSMLQQYSSKQYEKEGSLWIAIVSLITGILAIVTTLVDGEWDNESIEAFLSFVTLSLGFGIFGIVKKLNGIGMSITGVVLSSLAILIAIGY